MHCNKKMEQGEIEVSWIGDLRKDEILVNWAVDLAEEEVM